MWKFRHWWHHYLPYKVLIFFLNSIIRTVLSLLITFCFLFQVYSISLTPSNSKEFRSYCSVLPGVFGCFFSSCLKALIASPVDARDIFVIVSTFILVLCAVIFIYWIGLAISEVDWNNLWNFFPRSTVSSLLSVFFFLSFLLWLFYLKKKHLPP